YDKNGTRYYFGQSPVTRIQGPPGIYLWALDNVVDRNGNSMSLTYAQDQNQLYPQDILYTSNSVAGRAADRKVHFTLETRPDPFSSYRAGFSQVMGQRLVRIDTSVLQNNTWKIAKTYSLSYAIPNNRVRSELTSIQLSALDGNDTQTIQLAKNNYLPNNGGW